MSKKPALAKDSAVFMEWFDPEINKHINLSSLRKKDTHTKIFYFDNRGIKRSIAPYSFFNNVRKNKGVFKSKFCAERAIDNLMFAEWYESNCKNYNHGLDVTMIRKNDDSPIKYLRADGSKGTISVSSFFRNIRKNGKFIEPRSRHITRCKLAKDCPGFMDFFNQSLNPEINTEKLYQSNSCTYIKYLNEHGEECTILTCSLIKNLLRNNGRYIHYNRNNNVIYNYNRNGKKCYAGNVPGFLEWFDASLNPDINPHTLCISSNISIYFVNKYGIVDSRKLASICNNLKKNNGVYVESNHTIKGINDVATLDPDIVAFWGDNKTSPDHLSPYSGHHYNFVCPYCGNKFTKEMKNIAFRHPKCAVCRDGELSDSALQLLPENVPFAIREPDKED